MWLWRLCTLKSHGAIAQGSQLCIEGVAAMQLIPVLGRGYFGYPVFSYIYMCVYIKKNKVSRHIFQTLKFIH